MAPPADVQVYEDLRLVGSGRSDRLMVPVGRHELDIVNEALGFRQRRSVNVTPGQTTAIRLDWPNGSMAINAQPWAEVFIDGEREPDMWIAPAITVGRELDRDKLARFFSEWEALVTCGPQGARTPRGTDRGWAAFTDGYPVRITDPGGNSHEVVKAEQRTVPATEFAPPAGFTKKTFGEFIPR